jgi:hypothetical protein
LHALSLPRRGWRRNPTGYGSGKPASGLEPAAPELPALRFLADPFVVVRQ